MRKLMSGTGHVATTVDRDALETFVENMTPMSLSRIRCVVLAIAEYQAIVQTINRNNIHKFSPSKEKKYSN